MIQRTNKLTSQRANPGLTLVELVIAMAVSGIIVLITFSGFRAEQQRSATKDATDRLQIELIGLQNKMQSGVAINTKYCIRSGGNYSAQGNPCTGDANCLVAAGSPGSGQGRCISGPPGGFGISIFQDATTYSIFADMPNGLTPLNGIYDPGATNDLVLTLNKSLGKNIRVASVKANDNVSPGLDISFSGINGDVIIHDWSGFLGCGTGCTTAKIVLKHTVTGTCYAIIIDSASQIVGRRQLSPNCQ